MQDFLQTTMWIIIFQSELLVTSTKVYTEDWTHIASMTISLPRVSVHVE